MGVAGDMAPVVTAEEGLMGERFVGDATVREERLRDSEEVVLFRGSFWGLSDCCCC